jgi:hypothetical protein
MPVYIEPGTLLWQKGLSWLFGLFSVLHHLTSPKITSRQGFPYRQNQSDVSTLSGWVSLYYYSPIRPITGRPSLLPTSHSLCLIPLPYGWDTVFTGGIGFTQLTTEKIRFGRIGVYTPVGVLVVAACFV